jgi:hypothetical protein
MRFLHRGKLRNLLIHCIGLSEGHDFGIVKVMLVALPLSLITMFHAGDSRSDLAQANLEGCSKLTVKKSLQHLQISTPFDIPTAAKWLAHSLIPSARQVC